MALEGLLKGASTLVLVTSEAGELRTRGEVERREHCPGTGRGQEALPPLSRGPLWSHPASKSYIYWEINTPRGVLFQTSQKTQWGRGSCGLGHNTDPEPFWNSRWEKTLRTLVPFDFKGKLEKGNSKSISPKKVRFPLDKDRASQVSACAGTETPEAFVTHTKRSFGPF